MLISLQNKLETMKNFPIMLIKTFKNLDTIL